MIIVSIPQILLVFCESGLIVEFAYETKKQVREIFQYLFLLNILVIFVKFCTEYFEDFTDIPNIYKYECYWGSLIPGLTLILGLFSIVGFI